YEYHANECDNESCKIHKVELFVLLSLFLALFHHHHHHHQFRTWGCSLLYLVLKFLDCNVLTTSIFVGWKWKTLDAIVISRYVPSPHSLDFSFYSNFRRMNAMLWSLQAIVWIGSPTHIIRPAFTEW